jgi:hypothetical protein
MKIAVLLLSLLVVGPASARKKNPAPPKEKQLAAGSIKPRERTATAKKELPVPESRLAAVIQENRATMGLCYQKILKHEPGLTGAKMVTKLKIESSGQVANVSFDDPELGDADIGQCLAQAIKRWSFPAAGSEYDFEFPLMLSAD